MSAVQDIIDWIGSGYCEMDNGWREDESGERVAPGWTVFIAVPGATGDARHEDFETALTEAAKQAGYVPTQGANR